MISALPNDRRARLEVTLFFTRNTPALGVYLGLPRLSILKRGAGITLGASGIHRSVLALVMVSQTKRSLSTIGRDKTNG